MWVLELLCEWKGIYPMLPPVENVHTCGKSIGWFCWWKYGTETKLETPTVLLPPTIQTKQSNKVASNNNHTHTHTCARALGWTWHPNKSVATPNRRFWDLDAFPVLIWTFPRTPDFLQPSPALENLLSITHIWHSLQWWLLFYLLLWWQKKATYLQSAPAEAVILICGSSNYFKMINCAASNSSQESCADVNKF